MCGVFGPGPAVIRRKLRGMATGFAPATKQTVTERSGGVCERCGVARAVHLHHRLLRRFGDHSVANALHLCVFCHDAVHSAAGLSYDCGWMIASGVDVDPASVPVVYRGESVRLDQGGMIVLST
jgi:hypothetical protein